MSIAQLRRIRAALEFGQRFCEIDMERNGIEVSSALSVITESLFIIQEEIDKLEPPTQED